MARANHSVTLYKKSNKSIPTLKRLNHTFNLSLSKNEQFVQNTKDCISSPGWGFWGLRVRGVLCVGCGNVLWVLGSGSDKGLGDRSREEAEVHSAEIPRGMSDGKGRWVHF